MADWHWLAFKIASYDILGGQLTTCSVGNLRHVEWAAYDMLSGQLTTWWEGSFTLLTHIFTVNPSVSLLLSTNTSEKFFGIDPFQVLKSF